VSVRAHWGLQALSEAGDGQGEVDPFDQASSLPVTANTDWRFPCGIETPREDLQKRLNYLYRREGRLFNAGITCPVKDSSESSCNACPFAQAEDPEGERCHLCRIGIDQERIQTVMVAQVAAREHAALAASG
jgi:hypothetical protein